MSEAKALPTPDYLVLVLRNWRIVAAGTILCAILGALAALAAPKMYESSATVLIYPPTFKKNPSPEAMGLADLMPRALPVETYRTIAESKDILNEIITTLNLEDMAVEVLADWCTVELTELGSKTPQYGTRYSQTLVFLTKANDPELAAQIAQTWAEIFTTRTDTLMAAGLDDTFKLIESMWTSAKDNLEESEDALDVFDEEWNLELLRSRAEAKERVLTELETSLVEIEVDLATRKATLESIQAELAKEQKIETLFRAPPDEVYWLAGPGAGGNEGDTMGPETGLRTEYLNPNYTAFREKEISLLGELQGLDQKKTNSLAEIDRLQTEIDALRKEVVTRATERARLERSVEARVQTNNLAVASLEKGKIAQLNNVGDVQIAAKAVVPGKPIGLRRAFKAAIAALLGALISIAAVVARETLRASGAERSTSQ